MMGEIAITIFSPPAIISLENQFQARGLECLLISISSIFHEDRELHNNNGEKRKTGFGQVAAS